MLFPEVPQVLLALYRAGVQIAVASHNTQPVWCGEVMDNYVLDADQQIFWGDLVPPEMRNINCGSGYWPAKRRHLEELAANHPGGPCSMVDMILFDDGKKICQEATKLGV